jgi:hypothetical protein
VRKDERKFILHRKTYFDETNERLIIVEVHINGIPINAYVLRDDVTHFNIVVNEPYS